MYCRLTKLSKNTPMNYRDLNSKGVIGGLRTSFVEGRTSKTPTVGESVKLSAEALDENYCVRAVTTSHVVQIDFEDNQIGKWVFTTETGSVYLLEKIPVGIT